jgi:hypothetical protein
MKKYVVIIFLIIVSNKVYAQEVDAKITNLKSEIIHLDKAPKFIIGIDQERGVSIKLPDIKGEMTEYKFFKNDFMSQEMQKKYPEITTYTGYSLHNKSEFINIVKHGDNINGLLMEHSSHQVFKIEKGQYSLKETKEDQFNQNLTSECGTNHGNFKPFLPTGLRSNVLNVELRKFRLAIVITDEFEKANNGGDDAIAAATFIISNLNAIYKKELSIEFQFTIRPETNTYNISPAVSSIVAANAIIRYFNIEEYDLGHVLHHSVSLGGSGIAALGVVCNNFENPTSKARGWTQGNPTSSEGFLRLLAHEIGHMFGATHTFNGTYSICGNVGQLSPMTSYEPGAGTSLMSYGGTCASHNIQVNGIDVLRGTYFHAVSIAQILDFLESDKNVCENKEILTNSNPVIGSNLFGLQLPIKLPKSTPFELKGQATDLDNDVLTYCWEQMDKGPPHGGVNVACGSENGPIFRSYEPGLSPSRFFPDLQYILNNNNAPGSRVGECLPSVSRDLNFRLTVRDNHPNGGGIAFDNILIKIDGEIGPMLVTAPNTQVIWTSGAKQTVTWTVNRTNEICNSVNILLSVDGGFSFPFRLAKDIPNSGLAELTLPESIPPTITARIKVESSCSEFIKFFDISNSNFNLNTSCPILFKYGICNDNPVVATEGSEALSLNLPKEVNKINTDLTISTAGPRGSFPVNLEPNTSGPGSCRLVVANYYLQKFEFVINKSGVYVFDVNGSGIISIFNNLYNPSSPCDNYIGSNSYYVNLLFYSGQPLNIELSASCQKYTLVLFSQNIINNKKIKINGPEGTLVLSSELINPDFDVSYLAVDSQSHIIKSIHPTGDFKGLSPGTYKIYGLYYYTGSALLPKKLDIDNLLNNKLNDVLNYNSCFVISQNFKPLTVLPLCPPNTISVDIIGPRQSCSDKTVTISTNNGTKYKWSTGSDASQIDVGPGTYGVTVSDENGCTASASINITSLPLPEVQISGNLSICQNSETELTASGGLSYSWSTGNESNTIKINPNSSQNYSVTATDFNGCSASQSVLVTVNIPSKPVIFGVGQSCEDQIVNLVSSEGISYIWNTGATTRSIMTSQSGIYDVIVTDENGCTDKSVPFEVVFFSPGDIPPHPVVINNSTCTDCIKIKGNIGSPDFNCPTGYRLQYSTNNGLSWSFDLPVYDESEPLEISVRCGCSYDPTFGGQSNTVSTNPQSCPEECGCANFTVEILGENAVCENQMTTLTISDGIEFLWSTGENTKSIVVGPGVYGVTVTDISDCVAEASIHVYELSLPTIQINGQKEVCAGQLTLLNAEGGIEYLWSNLENSSSVTVSPGIYTVTVTNDEGCKAEASVDITALPLPLVNITGKNKVCIGQTVELKAEGGIEYQWSNQENTQTISVVAGTYSVTVTNEFGCSASKDFTIMDLLPPIATISGNDFVCNNEVTEITARGGIRFKWSNNAETPGIFVRDGLYSVTVTNEDGCTASVSKSVQKAPDPKPLISGVNALCEGEMTQLTVNGGQSFVWSTGETSTYITVGPGIYTVTATNEFNCSATAHQIISSKPKPYARIEGNTNICSGQTTVITASGGVSYNWSTGTQSPSIQVSPSSNTSYRVTVTGTNGCTDIETIFITVNSDPVVPASEIRFSAVNRNQMTLNWRNGDGVNRIVVARANSPVVNNPSNGFNYIANQAFGFGSTLSSSEFVVYNGTGSSVTVTNLIENNIYHFRIFEYGCTKKYLTTFASGNPASQITNCMAPTLQATNITFSLVSTQQFTINWSNGNGSRRVVKINTINQFTPPTNGTDPIANPVYSGSGEQVIYNGNGNSVTVTGLKPNTVYWVRVYEANCEGVYSLYNTTVATQNPNSQQTVLVPPYIQSFSASTVTPLPGGGTQRQVFYHNTDVYGVNSPVIVAADASNNTVFTLKASFITGMGFRIVNKQGKIVTNGDIATDPARYGILGVKQVLSHNTLEMTYTHPQFIDEAVLPLRIQLLFYNGLLGLTIPLELVAATPLPVEITKLSAYHDVKNNLNEISWTTQSERNNARFVILRKIEKENMIPVAEVKGAGNSDIPLDYIVLDKDLQRSGTYYYQLEQVDFDGSRSYSDIVQVSVQRTSNITTSIYPNPTNGTIYCKIEGKYDNAQMHLYDPLGNKMAESLRLGFENQNVTPSISCEHLAGGVYQVVIWVDGEVFKHKVIFIK